MSEPLCDLSGGSLRTASVGAILIEALRSRATGELKIDANGGTSKIYLRAGQPCGAQIFFGFKSLGQFLLELGWIDLSQLERSLAEVAEGRRQGQALVELGALTEERLRLGLALHHQSHIRTLAALDDGSYALLQVPKLPAWTDEIRISAHRAILDALSTAPGLKTAEQLLVRIPAGQGLRLREGWEKFAARFQLDATEAALTRRLARSTAPGILARSGLPGAERAPALCAAFLLMGLAAPAAAETGETPTAAAPPEEEEPALELVPGEALTPASSAAERMRRLVELQEQELAKMEAQQHDAAQESLRLRTSREEASRRAKEEALNRPAPQFKSDAAEGRERRNRLLKRAFGNIVGGQSALRRPGSEDPGGPPHEPIPQPPPPAPATASRPAAQPVLRGDDAKLAREIEERHRDIVREDFFTRLGLGRDAKRDQVKQAFFQAAKVYHPDKMAPALQHLGQKMKEVFAAINEAYETLQDDERRKSYLKELVRSQAAGGLTAKQEDELKTLIAMGDMAMKRRVWADAETHYRAASRLQERPDLIANAAWALYSDPARKDGREKAVDELRGLTKKWPNTAQAHYYLGVIERVDGSDARAEQYFRAAIKVNPKHAEANQELRILQMRKKH